MHSAPARPPGLLSDTSIDTGFQCGAILLLIDLIHICLYDFGHRYFSPFFFYELLF
eukprot:COSAG01_NODE_3526_length_5971_cov_13.245305_4_plen_56_part_00